MDFVGCCKVRDNTIWFGTLITLAAFILSLFASNHCDFLKVKLHDDIEIPDDVMSALETLFPGIGDGLSLGIFTREDISFGDDEWNCRRWNTNDSELWWDATYRAAMSMAFVANVFGICGIILALNAMCFKMEATVMYMISCLCIFVGICQALVFVVFATDKCGDGVIECEFSSMAGVNVAATALWFIAACCFLKSTASSDEEEGGEEEGEAAEKEAEAEAGEGDEEKPEGESDAKKEQPLDEEAAGEEGAEGDEKKEEGEEEEDSKKETKEKKGLFGLW